MKYLYTTEPDEGCRKVETGIYGRPVHTTEQPKLKAKGWKETVNELREEEGREETEEEVSENMDFDEYLRRRYEEVFGKKPHHKMKPETMQAKIDEAEADDNNPV